jgi:hypothetical protein
MDTLGKIMSDSSQFWAKELIKLAMLSGILSVCWDFGPSQVTSLPEMPWGAAFFSMLFFKILTYSQNRKMEEMGLLLRDMRDIQLFSEQNSAVKFKAVADLLGNATKARQDSTD